MDSPSESVPMLRDYMSHFSATENDPFVGNYAAVRVPYEIDVLVPSNAPVPADVSRKIYSTRGDAPTAFLLWMKIPSMAANVEPGRIVLLHSVSQFASRLGHPTKK